MFAGGQVRSFLSLLSYLGKGEQQALPRHEDPAARPQAGLPEQAHAFANGLAMASNK
jgi:hypothetical protein